MLNDVPPEPLPENSPASTPAGGKSPKRVRNLTLRSLQYAQRYSAYTFSAFAGLHLSATVVAPLISLSAAESTFMFGRAVYQSTLGEPILVYGSVLVHVVSGLILHAHRVYMARKNYGKWSFQSNSIINSGLLLTVLVAAHATVTRVAPVVALGDSSDISLQFITWSLQNTPLKTATALFLLVFVYGYHAVSGSNKWLRLKLGAKKWIIISALVGLAAISIGKLHNAPSVGGYLASQFELAHHQADAWLS